MAAHRTPPYPYTMHTPTQTPLPPFLRRVRNTVVHRGVCFFVLSLDDRRNSILCRCFRRRDVYRRRHGKSMCHPPRWLSSSGTFIPFDCSAAFWNQTVSTSLPGLPPLLRGALATTLTPKSIFFLVLFCFAFFFGGGEGGFFLKSPEMTREVYRSFQLTAVSQTGTFLKKFSSHFWLKVQRIARRLELQTLENQLLGQ